MTTITIDSTIYREGIEHSVELEIPDIDSSDKTTLVSALQNAGRMGVINSPLADIQHYDTTTDDSNTVTFVLSNYPDAISSSVTLIIESYSVEITSPTPSYTFRIRGFSE